MCLLLAFNDQIVKKLFQGKVSLYVIVSRAKQSQRKFVTNSEIASVQNLLCNFFPSQ